ncbi:MAG: DUF1801 domain-containing protein [Calditrichaeota bacterium]|nr:DUF1801 domain-containing protein [Calditrichota bacterium]
MTHEITEYILAFPEEIQKLLKQMYNLISESAPEAEESISYGMPAFKISGKPLVYFAGYKNHIGFYATPSGHEKFASALSKYKQGKGSVQFPVDQELPASLIKEIVEFRVAENHKKLEVKKKR